MRNLSHTFRGFFVYNLLLIILSSCTATPQYDVVFYDMNIPNSEKGRPRQWIGINDGIIANMGTLQPDDVQDGTYTVTNVGMFDSLMGTPIINQPQVAIIGTGAIVKRPMVMETDQGDVIAIRHMMYLSMSYDHRIIDGAHGGAFVSRVKEILEQFDIQRDI